MTGFLVEIPLSRRVEKIDDLFIRRPLFSFFQETDEFLIVAWGDPIVRKPLPEEIPEERVPQVITENITGHYYYLTLTKSTGRIVAGNSMFGILPLYYCGTGDRMVASDNAINLGKHVKNSTVSGRFVLEMVLFGYPLFNHSILEEIKLLGSNSYLSVCNGKWTESKHFTVEDIFVINPLPWKRVVEETAENSIETFAAYMPDRQYASALTGGFDGRTLMSVGLRLGKEMTAFTFGTEDSDDVMIASGLAASAGIPFRWIALGDDYVNNESLMCGEEFILNSSGAATFARAHYLYSSKLLARDFRVMVTGNFGSEIFRSPHIAGTVISPNIVSLFTAGTPLKAYELLEETPEFKCLNIRNLEYAWESLKSDITMLPCFNPGYAGLTMNQKFYVFVFEEVFRKYFGAEMANQFRYLINRTPFLDVELLKVIFGSRLAGIHSDFFEHNPVKRFKGQVLYAHIIRKSYPAFGKILTDKGYAPCDLLTLHGKASIAFNYARKKLMNKRLHADPYAVTAAWERNRHFWETIPIPGEFFNQSTSNDPALVRNRNLMFKIISLSAAISMLQDS
jgi:hypothetical protein